MGLLDSIVGNVLGNAGGGSALTSILGSLLGGQGGVSGLVQKMEQAGLGNVVNSWVGNGPNQPVEPHQLQQAFGQQQVDQWSQQTGMSQDTVLSSLSKLLPHAVDQATPSGQIQDGDAQAGQGQAGQGQVGQGQGGQGQGGQGQGGSGASPFDEAGFEMPKG